VSKKYEISYGSILQTEELVHAEAEDA